MNSEFSLIRGTFPIEQHVPATQSPEPSSQSNPADFAQTQPNQTSIEHPPEEPPKPNNNPNSQGNVQPSEIFQDSSSISSYKEKLIKESKKIYFPTWLEYIEAGQPREEDNQNSIWNQSIPKIAFTKKELLQMRKPCRKSLVIQIVRLNKYIMDISFHFKRILRTKEKWDITYIGQDFKLSSLTTRKITSYQL